MDNVRIDKWLWAARFYKVRSLASSAIKGGHVYINGTRAKASKLVHINDEVQLQKDQVHFTIIIRALADKRGSATIAQTLYQETETSLAQRQKQAEQRQFQSLAAPAPAKRPDKRDRRKIKQYKAQF